MIYSEEIFVVRGVGEVIFYFSPKMIVPDDREVIDVGHALIYNGDCTGMDVSRLFRGEVRIFFNPIVQNEHNIAKVIEKMTKAIRALNFSAILDE